ncbi:MAG: hypothetical protein HFE73_04235 [Firmicutes bacterium]|jgi:hypothetical protein|nr:hypothetical protein [Bacillota bacterium]
MGNLKIRKNEYSADEALREVAKLSKEEFIERDKEYLKRVESIDQIFPIIGPDQNFLEFARAYDKKAEK